MTDPTMVERLAKRWGDRVLSEGWPEMSKDDPSGDVDDARWWLKAIADEIERDYWRAHGNTTAYHLRSEADR